MLSKIKNKMQSFLFGKIDNEDDAYLMLYRECGEFSGQKKSFSKLSNRLYNSKDFVLKAMREHCVYSSAIFDYINPKFKNDHEVIVTALMGRVDVTKIMSDELKKDLDILSVMYDKGFMQFKDLPIELRGECKLAMGAVLNDIDNFSYVADILKSHYGFILSCVVINIHVLKFVDDDIKADKEFASKLVEKNSYAFEYVGDNLKNDEEFAFFALCHDLNNLKYVGEDLLKNKNFILRLCAGSGYTVKVLAELGSDFIDDIDIAYEASLNFEYTKEYVSKRLAQLHDGGEFSNCLLREIKRVKANNLLDLVNNHKEQIDKPTRKGKI